MAASDETAELAQHDSRAGVNHAAVLRGEPDVVRIVHPGEKPIKELLRWRDPERFEDLNEPAHYAVGKEFSRAIERWEIGHRGDPGVETGRTVRPHMRRAHSHLYWTEPGRTQPRVRFLLPISVKGGRVVEERQSAAETTVR